MTNEHLIAPLTDGAIIRAFLERDLDYAAYALGDLDPRYANAARWFGAWAGPSLDGLALHYTSLDPEVLFLMGDPDALRALLASGPWPRRVYYTAKPDIEPVICEFYTLHDVFHMFRMRVRPDTFQPVLPDGSLPAPTRLGDEHVAAIEALQRAASAADGRPMHEVAFIPEMVQGGYYHGLFEAGRLIAVAGTHIAAPHARMAALGNVVVHPDYRRRGLGVLVSSAVTQALLDDGFDLVVLNVRQDNVPAVATYRRLGYYHSGEFIEGLAERRST